MSIISFASSKGGAGRTTSAIALASMLACNYRVTLIDADHAVRLLSWSKKGPLPARLTVRRTKGERFIQKDKGERFIQKDIDEASKSSDFVIIDQEVCLRGSTPTSWSRALW